MVLILFGFLGLAALVVWIVMSQRTKDPNFVPAGARFAPVDDEPTQVRLVGHRFVRVAGGVNVGDPFPLFDSATIGRNKTCAVCLGDTQISGVHAKVKIDLDHAYIADCNSTNGTLLNEEQLPPDELRLLKEGDRVKVGSITLVYRSQP